MEGLKTTSHQPVYIGHIPAPTVFHSITGCCGSSGISERPKEKKFRGKGL